MEERFVLFLIICVFMTRPAYALKNLKFNRMLKGHIFRTIPGISLDECWSNCETRAECRSINYKRNSHLCHLNYGAQPLTLTTQPGVVFHEKPESTDMDNVECGLSTCDKNEVCDTETKTCRVQECKPPHESDSVDILGNMASIGSKKYFSCKEGFMPSAGSTFSTVAECFTDGWKNDLECIPLTCKGLADMGETASDMYRSYDEDSQSIIDIFCEFNKTGRIGYSFLSPVTLNPLINISKHYTGSDHIMLRHVRNGGEQYESKMGVLPDYRGRYNVSVFKSDHPDFNPPTQVVTKPYLYIAFVPNSYGDHQGKTMGYSCDGQNFTFVNSDNNKNNYFVIYESQNVVTKCWGGGQVWNGWVQCSKPIDPTHKLPDDVFFNRYEIHMGGGGCLVQNCQELNVDGTALGLPFNY